MATFLQRIGLVGGGLVLLAALVLNALLGAGAIAALEAGYDETFVTQRALRRVTVLRGALADAETGQRGFLLTGDPAYLEPYARATDEVRRSLDSLAALGRPYPEYRAAVPRLRRLAEAKLGEVSETLVLARNGQRDAALALVETDRGVRLMDTLRAELDVLEAAGRGRRDRRRIEADRAARRAQTTLVVSNGALLVLLGLFLWRIRESIRARERASAELRAANAAIGQALAEREAALTNLHAMQAQVVQQEKLAGLGRLTAGVAHELKNPLNFVNNFAQLADEMGAEAQAALDAGDADEARQVLTDLRLNTGKVVEHGRRADEIVRTMLVHARGVSGERQRVDLDAVLAQAAGQALGPDDRRPVSVVRRDGAAGVAVWGVPSALTRLFLNLIENAVQAVRERAGAQDGAYEPTVWLAVRRGFDRMGRSVAVVTVEDNGPGIAEAVLPRVFEPFYTTKAPGQGTGLGLSLAYDIAVGHGGTLTAGRARGGGACLTVTLPLDPPPDEADGPAAQEAAGPTAAGV